MLDKLFCSCDYFLQISATSLLKNQCKKLLSEIDKLNAGISQSPNRSPRNTKPINQKYFF